MTELRRRDFLKFVLSGTAMLALSRCAPGAVVEPDAQTATPEDRGVTPAVPPGTEPSATAIPTALPTPSATPQTLLRNENREGFYVRYYKAFAPVDAQAWSLTVGGQVRHPQSFSLDDLLALPAVTQISRMKCVEGWSVAAQWGGFRPQALVDLVLPQASATWAHFYCADDYYESLPLGDLMLDRVLFAYDMDGKRLEPAYGAPLRLIVPFKYGYKGPKAITRIEFASQELRGYWPTVGPYSTEGDVQPGQDYALDLGEYRQVNKWGEIVYEDGPEGQED